MSITLSAYFMGRGKQYAADLTPEIEKNAAETVRRINLLLTDFYVARPEGYPRIVNSGWRPAALNAKTKGAALHSLHITAQACDLSDGNGALDAWCLTSDGVASLTMHELWQESPGSTPGWCHLQTVPPRSLKRVFLP